MPKVSSSRNANNFIVAECKKLVGKRGTFLGYNSDVNDDGKVSVNVFYYTTDAPSVAKSFPVTDRAVMQAVINPASVPVPEAREAKAATTAAKK